MVVGLLVEDSKVVGVRTSLGLEIKSKTVVLTNGTFLNGQIHVGKKQFKGGRSGESAAYGISESLKTAGFKTGRMKTGTPPRVDGRSINFNFLERDSGDKDPRNFSFLNEYKILKQEEKCLNILLKCFFQHW